MRFRKRAASTHDTGSASEAALAVTRKALDDSQERIRRLQALARSLRDSRDGLARTHRRLEAAILGVPAPEAGALRKEAASPKDLRALTEQLELLHAEAIMVETLRRGGDLDRATVATVRALLGGNRQLRARSMAYALLAEPSSARAGHLGLALVARFHEVLELAWDHFQQVPRDVWQALAPVEYLDVAFSVDKARAHDECRRLLAASHPLIGDGDWFSIATLAYGAGDVDTAAALLSALDERRNGSPALTGDAAAEYAWLIRWIREERRRARTEPARPPGPVFAVLDYKQPDRLRTSANLGDYIQTLASLGHLARYPSVTFTGNPPLTDFMARLQARVPTDRRIDRPGTEVALVEVNRDATNGDVVPAGTWMLAVGWYMRPIFGKRVDFPFHPNLRPLFISFHINRRAMVTEESVAYLRRYAPIGCRDWSTVYLLQSVGVPAFFSGCITTTTDMVFPRSDSERRDPATLPIAFVDAVPAKTEETGEGIARLSQASPDVRDSALATNLDASIEQLEDYRTNYCGLVTSRLHCYLPATALGVPVDFRPRNLADVRFDGLLGLAPGHERLVAMQSSITQKLQAVVERILAGASEDAVYDTWREVCAPAVAEAEARRGADLPQLRPSFDVAAVGAAVGRASRSFLVRPDRPGDTVHVVLALDGNLRRELPVVLESVTSGTSRPLHFWILTRDLHPDDFAEWADDFPMASLTFLPCDDVDYGPVPGMLGHITVSTMDRLLLPQLLPDVSRVVYHDIDAVTLGDIAEIYDIDLQGFPLAARTSHVSWAESGFGNVYRAAMRLAPDVASELRRRMHARMAFDFRIFNAGVMVLDLDRMRADDFCTEFIPYAERYGMNDQDVLNCYVGPARRVLPREWNAAPSQDVVVHPKLVHWAGPMKPWAPDFVLFADIWARFRDQYERRTSRTADPPKIESELPLVPAPTSPH